MEEIENELCVNYFPMIIVIIIGSFILSEIDKRFPSESFSRVIPEGVVSYLNVRLEVIA